MPDPDTCVVFVTAPSREEAERIAEAVVGERLAACCNIVPGLRSIYHWKGEVCRDDELLMILKTRQEKFDALRARVVELHPYEVPEVVAMPIVAGNPEYLEWLRAETETDGECGVRNAE